MPLAGGNGLLFCAGLATLEADLDARALFEVVLARVRGRLKSVWWLERHPGTVRSPTIVIKKMLRMDFMAIDFLLR